MTLCHSLPLLEVRSQAQGLIEGYASVFGGVDSHGDSIAQGAFTESLTRHRAAGTWPVMLWTHKLEVPVGRWTALDEDSRGLRAAGQINMQTAAGKEVYAHLSAGDLNGLSIGYRVPEGGMEYCREFNLLKRLDLHEVSIVSVPSDSAARISTVKSLSQKPATLRGFEEALEILGYSRREARNIAAKGFGASAELVSDGSQEIIEAIKASTQLFQKA